MPATYVPRGPFSKESIDISLNIEQLFIYNKCNI